MVTKQSIQWSTKAGKCLFLLNLKQTLLFNKQTQVAIEAEILHMCIMIRYSQIEVSYSNVY